MIAGFLVTQIKLGLDGIFNSWILRLTFSDTEVP